MSYNGWSNYETWNIKLWLDNDYGMYQACQEWAQSAWDDAEADSYSTREQVAARSLADTVEEFIKENKPDLGASCYADLLNAALDEVDWYEIAESLLEDVEKEEEEESEEEEEDEADNEPADAN